MNQTKPAASLGSLPRITKNVEQRTEANERGQTVFLSGGKTILSYQ